MESPLVVSKKPTNPFVDRFPLPSDYRYWTRFTESEKKKKSFKRE
jgi:hypothetical protein